MCAWLRFNAEELDGQAQQSLKKTLDYKVL